MPSDLRIDPDVVDLAVGLAEAVDLRIGESGSELRLYCQEVAQRTIAQGLRGGDDRRTAVRQLLRAGGFKPAGRSKPAQEYLLRTVTEQGGLPSINNAVDVINAVSLDCGLPISLVAIQRTGPQLTIRYGRAGERFVFNRAGQELDLAGLVCLCGDAPGPSTPLGTPVKDSMTAKVTDQDQHVLACIYAPRNAVLPGELREWCDKLGDSLVRWCGAATFASRVLPAEW